MTSNTILVVDDEPKVRRLLRHSLEGNGFNAVEAESEEGVLEALGSHDIDLVTLDLQLGGDNGLEIAKSIRQHSNVPIIMVTGRDDVIDRVVGLEVGADDYIIKPFSPREVIARIRSVLRRSASFGSATSKAPDTATLGVDGESRLSIDGLTVNLDCFELHSREGELLELTTGDFRLLAIFVQNPKRILSRDRLMDLLNGSDWAPLDRTIDNQVARFRKKIERNPVTPTLIKTVRGVGYMLASDVVSGKRVVAAVEGGV